MKKKLNVLVTGIGGGGHGEQIMKALKMSEKVQYNIIGADMSPFSMGLAKVSKKEILPAATHPDYLQRLIEVCRKYDIKALFHGSEPELKVMSNHRQQILDEDIFLPINPKSVIDLCMDKNKTAELLNHQGFQTLRYKNVQSINDIETIDYFPVVLKPSIGGGGSASVMIAQSKNELEMFTTYLLNEYEEFIVQEYVGKPQDEFTVGVLMDMDGQYINSIAMNRYILSSLSNRVKVKNRTANKQLGDLLAISSGISQGKIGKFEKITKPCASLAKSIGAKGSINLQCRIWQEQVYVFEINPRFSGTTSSRAMVGYNEPDILIRKHIFGENIITNFEYQEGTVLRGLEETLFIE
tara:strand:- start:6128 stop:7186 length:1059 start_codon:yes stop_codon:yes gene_type:complete